MPEMLKEKELIDLLRVSRKTARDWARKVGARRVVKGCVRYDLDTVRAALAASENDVAKGGKESN